QSREKAVWTVMAAVFVVGCVYAQTALLDLASILLADVGGFLLCGAIGCSIVLAERLIGVPQAPVGWPTRIVAGLACTARLTWLAVIYRPGSFPAAVVDLYGRGAGPLWTRLAAVWRAFPAAAFVLPSGLLATLALSRPREVSAEAAR